MTGRKHRWNGTATAGLFVLLGAASAMGQTAREIEDVFWEDALCEREREMRAYLEEYPDGAYVSEARACLEQGLGLTRQERVAVQRGLGELGQEPGPADGLFGGPETKTRRAIRGWQAAKGMGATGYLDREQAEVLIATGQAVEARERAAAEQTAQEEVARQAAAADDAAYAAAEQVDTAAAYGEYLEAYPAGWHASAARERQEAARRAEAEAAADDAAYAAAEQGDTAAAYGEYLEAYPAGRHASAARERQEAARAAEEEAARRAAERYRARRTFRDALRSGGEGPEMVVVPAGTFRMGSPAGEEGRYDDEGPVRRVTIGEAFAVGVYEVTFAEWDACVRAGGCEGHRPDDEGWGRGEQPVINVSWADAQAYVAWLSQESEAKYRLLSEAEWEYVTRAGSETRYSWGDGIGENRANCAGCGSRWDDEGTAPVGTFGANGFGVYDVHGNVWEWVEDCWNGNYAGAPTDGRVWTDGDCSIRVVRGGSWGDVPRDLRSASRYRDAAGYRSNYLGFRVARRLTS